MSDPSIEEILEQVDHARDLLPIDTIEYDETQDYLAHLADNIDHLLTKLDEAQERERVLLVGIATAKNLALTPSTTGGMITTLQAEVAAILSGTNTTKRSK